MTQVFVYGTLLEGEHNNRRFLQNGESKKIGDAKISGWEMHDLLSFPAIVPVSQIDKEVVGEVWEVSDGVFEDLDRLEGFPNFYNRTLVGTEYGESWVYYCEDARIDPVIKSGSWRQHLGKG